MNPNAAPTREWPPNLELSAWIARHFPPGHAGYAVDVGASDGISCSTSWGLEQTRWTVLCVEPNPVFWPKLKVKRSFVMTCACDAEPKEAATFYSFNHNPEAYSALRPTFPQDFPFKFGDGSPSAWTEFQVPVKTLEQCLGEAQFPRLDALAIDTEGTEQDVLRGLDLARWAPRVIVIEAWEAGKHDGYLGSFGYKKVGRLVDNEFYLKGMATDGSTQAPR